MYISYSGCIITTNVNTHKSVVMVSPGCFLEGCVRKDRGTAAIEHSVSASASSSASKFFVMVHLIIA